MSGVAVVLKKAVQIGIVVRDLDQSARILAELFGVGPFKFIEWPDRPGSKYWFRDREESIKIRQGFVQAGDLELELIQPIEGERNAYRQFLNQHGGDIHHVDFLSELCHRAPGCDGTSIPETGL